MDLSEKNQKIIDAVIAKSKKLCPSSLALIGVYGSAATGEEYEKSDLDLLILIEDDEGWQLGKGFVLDDTNIGYDIYCTNWDGLIYESECHHAKLSKLLDSQIVYIQKQESYDRLCELRKKTKEFLCSDERYSRVDELINQAKIAYANICLTDEIGMARKGAFGVINSLVDAVMLYYGSYFKLGTKRIFDELGALPIDNSFVSNIQRIAASTEVTEIQNLSKELLLYVLNLTKKSGDKEEITESLSSSIMGTYEEMFSNWRNKVEEAAKNKDSFASFMNLNSFTEMYEEVCSPINMPLPNIMKAYNPNALTENITLYDECLSAFEKIYNQVGMKVVHYKDVDEFVAKYLSE